MTSATARNWRTPTVVLVCGGLLLSLAVGTRHGFGLFLQPMTMELGGQFAMLPLEQGLITGFGWFQALLIISGMAALMAPLSAALVERPSGIADHGPRQSTIEAIRVWMIAIALGVIAALVNLPIDEREIQCVPKPAAA